MITRDPVARPGAASLTKLGRRKGTAAPAISGEGAAPPQRAGGTQQGTTWAVPFQAR